MKAEELLLPSISLPAFGTGAAGGDPNAIAEEIWSGLCKFDSTRSTGNVQNVNFTIINDTVYQAFKEVMKTKSSSVTQSDNQTEDPQLPSFKFSLNSSHEAPQKESNVVQPMSTKPTPRDTSDSLTLFRRGVELTKSGLWQLFASQNRTVPPTPQLEHDSGDELIARQLDINQPKYDAVLVDGIQDNATLDSMKLQFGNITHDGDISQINHIPEGVILPFHNTLGVSKAKANQQDMGRAERTATGHENKEQVTMVVYGTNKHEIDTAIQAAKDVYKDEIKIIHIDKPDDNEIIHQMTKVEIAQINALPLKHQHAVCIDIIRQGDSSRITVRGFVDDVPSVTEEIRQIMRQFQNTIRQREEAVKLYRLVHWEYKDSDGKFKVYNEYVNYELEKNYHEKKTDVKVQYEGSLLTFDLNQLREVATGRNIRRTIIIEMPSEWKKMSPYDPPELVDVPSSSPEYRHVTSLFAKTVPRNVTQVQRVQNQSLWARYMVHKRDVEQTSRTQPVERELWHGTNKEAIENISSKGLDRGYAGAHATACGRGAYFAVNAAYSSSNTYSRPDNNGKKYMFLCCVLTGDFCRGESHMKDVPINTSVTPHVKYNSVVDNPGNPSMFIIFSDTQAYPKYLVTF